MNRPTELGRKYLKSIKLNRGYMKKLDESLERESEARVNINNRCKNRACRLSRLQCCAKRGLDVSNDFQIMKSQEMRYTSMVQTIKDNSHGINLYQKFGAWL